MISINDPYIDKFKPKQIYDKQRNIAIPHQQQFKPTDCYKTVRHSEFEHMKEFDDKTYHTRDKDGRIITQPKNFLTNPYKKGFGNTTVGHLFEPI